MQKTCNEQKCKEIFNSWRRSRDILAATKREQLKRQLIRPWKKRFTREDVNEFDDAITHTRNTVVLSNMLH